jgi:hypothetical protein
VDFERLKRRLTIYMRKRREVTSSSLPPATIERLRFYQFKASTAAFLYERTGRTDVRVPDTPHYQFARALATDNAAEITRAEAYYRDYLKASWQTTDNDRLAARVDRFRRHFAEERSRGTNGAIILSRLEQPNGDLFVVDGNHRSAFALALGRDVAARMWPIDLVFLKFANIPAFYGTGHKNRPYQSLFLNQRVIVEGRRSDALERLQMLPDDVVKGRTILDVASNFGMSSLLARSIGAASCLGLEVSAEMVDFASRFAMFDGAYPHVQFRQFNIDDDRLAPGERFDSAFMFSIHDHLKRPERLRDIARDHVNRYVVFEGHPGTKRENYAAFFDSGLFKTVSQIGALRHSVFSERRNRLLWLCEKA